MRARSENTKPILTKVSALDRISSYITHAADILKVVYSRWTQLLLHERHPIPLQD